jgi:hypothetical protein
MPKPAVKDPSGLYEVERRAYHAARPGFRIESDAKRAVALAQQRPGHVHRGRTAGVRAASSQARRIRCGQDDRTS